MKIKNVYLKNMIIFSIYFICLSIINYILLLIGVIILFFDFGAHSPTRIILIINTILPNIFLIYFLSKNINKKNKPKIYFFVFLIIYELLHMPFRNMYFFYEDKKSLIDNFSDSMKEHYVEPFKKYKRTSQYE